MSEKDILNWANVLTGENRNYDDYYYVIEPVKRIEWRLKQGLSKQLIALTGFQGTGKTSALKYLSETLGEKAVYIKWSRDWMEQIGNEHQINEVVQQKLKAAAKDAIYDKLIKGREWAIKQVPITSKEVEDEFRKTTPEKILGKGRLKELTSQATKEALWGLEVIFIDFPDYTKTTRSLMSKDLDTLQMLWNELSANGDYANIVITIQKELFQGHFFFGKMLEFTIEPLKPEEFLAIFKVKFPECSLIADESLLLLGQLSRGVFRRFLKYLGLTIERFSALGLQPPITPAIINEAVPLNIIAQDMQLQLYDIFKDDTTRQKAIELLEHLRRSGAINQKDIAEFLHVSMATAGRMINSLERNYVTRSRGQGREWLISLQI